MEYLVLLFLAVFVIAIAVNYHVMKKTDKILEGLKKK